MHHKSHNKNHKAFLRISINLSPIRSVLSRTIHAQNCARKLCKTDYRCISYFSIRFRISSNLFGRSNGTTSGRFSHWFSKFPFLSSSGEFECCLTSRTHGTECTEYYKKTTGIKDLLILSMSEGVAIVFRHFNGHLPAYPKDKRSTPSPLQSTFGDKSTLHDNPLVSSPARLVYSFH